MDKKHWCFILLQNGANRVIAETTNDTKAEAIRFFSWFVKLPLDADGYHRGEPLADGSHITYCVAEALQ